MFGRIAVSRRVLRRRRNDDVTTARLLARRRRVAHVCLPPRRPDCVFQVHGDLFVDAARSAHFSRFLNHADRGTRPANRAAHATAPHGGFRGAALVVCFYATRDVAPGRAEFNHWFGRSRPNFSILQLGHIEVDSADFWTNRSLSSSSRSPAEEAASTLSRTLTLKSS